MSISPPGPLAYEGTVSVPYLIRNFAPSSANSAFAVPTFWIDPLDKLAWILVAKPNNVADWVLFASGSSALFEIGVDATAGSGTNPVLPTSLGLITFTGGQLAASTTANAIQAVSTAPNTVAIEIQRSKAVTSSTVGDNGVCHFSSTDFSVDTNGFVTLSGSEGLTFTGDSGTASPSSGNINVYGNTSPAATGLTFTGSGSTMSLGGTLDVAHGGTGDTSFTAYSVLCGGTTSTGALQNVSGVGSWGKF